MLTYRGVGGKADRRFVRQGVERQDLRLLDDAEEGQGEVAGDAEFPVRRGLSAR